VTHEGWGAEREAVVETARELARLGLVAGHSGNVSVRLSANPTLIAVTPSQRPYRSLHAQDILVVDGRGEQVSGRLAPSSETPLHLGIYAARQDAGAVIHTHSAYATVCAVAGLPIPPVVDELAVIVGGEVRVAAYAYPGTSDMAQKACEALESREAALLAMHGLVGLGRDLASALAVCELVERAAQVYVMARLLGMERTLPPEVVEAEQALYRERKDAARG
jgi:L-fuculose-phosphate aldolase